MPKESEIASQVIRQIRCVWYNKTYHLETRRNFMNQIQSEIYSLLTQLEYEEEQQETIENSGESL